MDELNNKNNHDVNNNQDHDMQNLDGFFLPGFDEPKTQSNSVQNSSANNTQIHNGQGSVQNSYAQQMNNQAPVQNPYSQQMNNQSPIQDPYNQQMNINPVPHSDFGSNISFVDNAMQDSPVLSENPISNANFNGVQPVQMENFEFNPQQRQQFNNPGFDAQQPQQFNNPSFDAQQPQQFNNPGFDAQQPQQFNNPGFDAQQPQQFDNSEFNAQQSNNNSNYNETNNEDNSGDYTLDFVKSWMGDLYDKTHSKKFNFGAAILGPAYFFYRKLIVPGILTSLITLIISGIATFLLSTSKDLNSVLLICGGVAIVSLILAVIYGFVFYPVYRNYVRKQLNTYKKEIPNTNQLINFARQHGGTSMVGVIVYYVVYFVVLLVLSTVAVSMGFNSILGGSNKASNNTNTISQTATDMKDYTFAAPYKISYDSNIWLFDDTDSSLAFGAYTLKYANQSVSNIKSALNVDSTTVDGRASILKTIVSSFTQAVGSSAQVETGSTNFVMKNNVYYAYVDVVSATSIARYYLVLLPEEDTIFEFILSTDDTVIDTSTSSKAIEVISTVNNGKSSNSVQESNVISSNTTVSNSTVTNSISNSVATNSVNTNSTLSNSVVTNSISSNTTSSNYVGVEVTNQTRSNNTINSSSDLDSLIIQ